MKRSRSWTAVLTLATLHCSSSGGSSSASASPGASSDAAPSPTSTAPGPGCGSSASFAGSRATFPNDDSAIGVGTDRRWARGSGHAIFWDPSRLPEGGYNEVQESDDGVNWRTVAQAARSAGRAVWKVPYAGPAIMWVRVAPDGEAPLAPISVRLTPSQNAHYKWSQVLAEGPFQPRDGAGALVYRDRMWLLGGWNPLAPTIYPRTCNNEVWSSSDGVHWRNEKPNTFDSWGFDGELDWEGRHTAGYVVYRNRMWILGGDIIQGRYQMDAWSSEDGQSWLRESPDMGMPQRALQYTVNYGEKLWIMGGQTMPDFVGGGTTKVFDDVWMSTDARNWDQVPQDGPHWAPRGIISGQVVFDNKMWVVGGGVYTNWDHPERTYYNDVWSSSDGKTWNQHGDDSIPWDPRQYLDVAVYDGRIFVLGGYNQRGNLNDVWFTQDGENWYEVADTPWIERHAASTWVFKGGLYIGVGNAVQGGAMHADLWRLDAQVAP